MICLPGVLLGDKLLAESKDHPHPESWFPVSFLVH